MKTDNHDAVQLPTLLDRLEWIIRERKWTHEQYSNYAGFGSRSHVSAILFRLRKDPTYAKRISVEILEKLATGGRVSLIWLQHGSGNPDLQTVSPPPHAPWPNLERCLKAEGNRWQPYIVDLARAQSFEIDPTPLEWSTILDALERSIANTLNPMKKLLKR
jgi:hypothetical protein